MTSVPQWYHHSLTLKGYTFVLRVSPAEQGVIVRCGLVRHCASRKIYLNLFQPYVYSTSESTFVLTSIPRTILQHTIMKLHVYILILCVALVTRGYAQQADVPQPIPQYAQDNRGHNWYVHQLALWEAECAKTPTKEGAWYNRFKAQRYSFFEDTTVTQKQRAETFTKLLADMKKAIPDSWEYHLSVWRNGGNNTELSEHLNRAYQLNPTFVEIIEELVTFYEVNMNRTKRDEFIKQWYAAKSFSPSLLGYAYNALTTLEPNAILVTCGDNDTYPFWMLQVAKNIRPDVVIMNTSLMCHPEYRPKFLKLYSIQADTLLLGDEHMARTSYEQSVQEFIRSVAQSNKRPFYVSITVDPMFSELIKDDLYLTGLANKYSPKRFDNIAVLKRNWEAMHLDYLTQTFYEENYGFNTKWLPLLNMNYIPLTALLYEHYKLSGDETKAEHIKNFALTLATAAHQEQNTQEYFESIANSSTTTTNTTTTVSTNTQQPDATSPLTLAPNPASTTLTLTLRGIQQAEIHITNVQGKAVYSTRMDSTEQAVDISQWANGVYTVRTTTINGTYNTMFTINR